MEELKRSNEFFLTSLTAAELARVIQRTRAPRNY